MCANADAAGSSLDTVFSADAGIVDGLAIGRIEDGNRHARTVYVGLTAATAFRRFGTLPTWRKRCEALLLDWPAEPSAQSSEVLSGAAWADYALFIAGHSYGQLLRDAAASLQPAGHFLSIEDATNPEPWWFAELAILHAVTSFALRSGDQAVGEAAKANALFHLQETQPDHATSQPWGINAFIAFPDALPLADQVLLAAQTQQPRGLGVITRMLLHDAIAVLG